MTWHTNTTGGSTDRPLPANCRGPAPTELDTVCRWCGRAINGTVYTSPISRRSITDWSHADTGKAHCRDYGDGWVSERRGQP